MRKQTKHEGVLETDGDSVGLLPCQIETHSVCLRAVARSASWARKRAGPKHLCGNAPARRASGSLDIHGYTGRRHAGLGLHVCTGESLQVAEQAGQHAAMRQW